MKHYVLIGQSPVIEPDLMAWARWFEAADRIVAQTQIEATVISTVFLGLDHHYGKGPPLLFETMIFTDGEAENYQKRCSTWLEAEAQHASAVSDWKWRDSQLFRVIREEGWHPPLGWREPKKKDS
jgi:hypothetical protein